MRTKETNKSNTISQRGFFIRRTVHVLVEAEMNKELLAQYLRDLVSLVMSLPGKGAYPERAKGAYPESTAVLAMIPSARVLTCCETRSERRLLDWAAIFLISSKTSDSILASRFPF